jgi:hypothetical protein
MLETSYVIREGTPPSRQIHRFQALLCVEVAQLSAAIGIRDSKHPSGGHLTLEPGRFAGLVARVKRDDLDV